MLDRSRLASAGTAVDSVWDDAAGRARIARERQRHAVRDPAPDPWAGARRLPEREVASQPVAHKARLGAVAANVSASPKPNVATTAIRGAAT